MKKVNKIVCFVLLFLILTCFGGILFSQQNNSDKNLKQKDLKSPAPFHNDFSLTNIIDPFSDRSSNERYLPLDGSNLPHGITILGIIIMESESNYAVLKIPGYKNSFFVKENDVISLREMSTGKGRTKVYNKNVYLSIRKIMASEIEVSQKHRPDKVIIIR